MERKCPDWFEKADNKVLSIYHFFSTVALICLVAIMLIAVGDVIGEKLAKAGLPITGIPNYADWIGYLHVPIVFLSAGFITLERGHTCVDIITSRLNRTVRRITEYFSMITGILISGFLAWRGIFFLLPDFITHHTTITTSSFGFPQWPFTVVYDLGLVLLTLSFVWALMRLIFNYTPPVLGDPGLQPDPIEEAEEGADN